ncbi:hypothetical protein KHA96_01600 [Bacillus sp. FJAT-49711]|uniref:hypothetical protein n=1 Tax=Bacillus sp. FJAT-49711 TaxID=2833585 RepID=UPI001BCA43BB|nr:hypothetical protein [Bacillus sp. FJAT-49711]MBS4217003.1 hypothetical protein [Bacillus sp. FJAT-49711]
MPLHWMKNKWFITIITTLILFTIILYIYSSQYRPVASQSMILENELKTEEKMLKVLEEKTANENSYTVESSFSLQEQIPVLPLTDQFILDIEKAETVANVYVENMVISEGEGLAAIEGTEQAETSSEVNEIEETEDQSQLYNLDELKKVTVSLSLSAKNYFDFEAFINYLESQTRIVQVEQISVSAPEEMTNIADENELNHYNIVISAFYIPGLTDLIDEAPKMDSPPPAKKKDPFNNFPEINKEKK